jgi:hypothetical protein
MGLAAIGRAAAANMREVAARSMPKRFSARSAPCNASFVAASDDEASERRVHYEHRDILTYEIKRLLRPVFINKQRRNEKQNFPKDVKCRNVRTP